MTTSPESPGPKDELNRLWWAVPSGFLIVLTLIILVLNPQPEKRLPTSSYDVGSTGYRAVYLLFEDLGFPVERLRRPTGGQVRWMLQPTIEPKKEGEAVVGWVRDGGLLLVSGEATAWLALFSITADLQPRSASEPIAVNAVPDVESFQPGLTQGRTQGAADDWGDTREGPIASIHRFGRGEVWVLHYPEILTNDGIKQPGNAVLTVRLAEAMLARKPGKLVFDEYCHGMHDRPTVFGLLFEPPVLWISLQGLLLTGLLLWRFVPRFGPVREPPPQRRRSRQEYLEAMAVLLDRKQDRLDAWNTARGELLRDMEAELGLAAGTDLAVLLEQIARRRPAAHAAVRKVLEKSAGSVSADLITALNELEQARDEFFHRRADRPFA